MSCVRFCGFCYFCSETSGCAIRREPVNLYKCRTIAQFKIGVWLELQGIQPDDIAECALIAPDVVKITNSAGQYLVVRWNCDHAEIDMTREE